MFRISTKRSRGFSLLEVVLAIAIFGILSSSMVGIVVQGIGLNRLSAEETTANQYASEGIEAAKSIKNQSYSLLVDSSALGLANSSGLWAFSGANNIFDKYTRTISVSPVQRDASGNIVATSGTVDPNTKKIVSTVAWNFSASRNDSVVSSTYLSNWNGEIPFSQRGGMIIYGNGGSTSDSIQYRLLDSNTWNWSDPLPAADVDPASTDKALRAAKLYSSTSRIEKILVSRHFNGSGQSIYAQVYNGASWGNVIQLSSWGTNGYLDVQNFDGTYLKNGDFMVVYSDNTAIPKFRIWNGTSWSSQNSLQTISNPPTYVVLKSRPDTNEAMAAIYDQSKNVSTQYFDGKGYTNTNWNSLVDHPSKSNDNSQRLVDFDWSLNSPTKGGLIFTSKSDSKALSIQIWTADQNGAGSFGTPVDTAAQTSNLGVLQITRIPKADGFLACDKDNVGTPQIVCYKSDLAPVWSVPINNILSQDTDHVIEQSFDVVAEQSSAELALGVFSDKTGTAFPAKFKTYSFATNTWDAAPITVNTTPYTTNDIKIVRMIHKDNSDDIMILIGDTNLNLYSFVWDGTHNAVYTAPPGRAFTLQGANGAAPSESWYDFAWD